MFSGEEWRSDGEGRERRMREESAEGEQQLLLNPDEGLKLSD